MIGQHLLRFFYKKKPRPNSFIYRDTIKHLADIDGDTLDLGGGPGYLYLYLKVKPYYVVQDLDYVMLSYGDSDVDKVQAAAEEEVFRKGAFDYIIIHDALHHFHNVELALRNATSISKKEIYIFEIELDKLLGKIIKVFELLLGFPGNFYKSKELVEKIREINSGLKIEIVKMGKFRYLLRALHQPHS